MNYVIKKRLNHGEIMAKSLPIEKNYNTKWISYFVYFRKTIGQKVNARGETGLEEFIYYKQNLLRNHIASILPIKS